MSLFFIILSIVLYFVIAFVSSVALYTIGYNISIDDGDIEDLTEYDDDSRLFAGGVGILWPLAVILAILIFIYLTWCYCVGYIGDKYISIREKEKSQ